jgi:hypothetical protein
VNWAWWVMNIIMNIYIEYCVEFYSNAIGVQSWGYKQKYDNPCWLMYDSKTKGWPPSLFVKKLNTIKRSRIITWILDDQNGVTWPEWVALKRYLTNWMIKSTISSQSCLSAPVVTNLPSMDYLILQKELCIIWLIPHRIRWLLCWDLGAKYTLV